MSADLGKPLLIPGPGALWLLAHVTPEGAVQPTFYNFPTIAEGLAFAAEHGEEPAIEVEGRRLRPSAIRILLAIAAGAGTLNLAQRRGHTGRLHAILAQRDLSEAGWLSVQPGRGTRGADRLQLTPSGEDLATRLRQP